MKKLNLTKAILVMAVMALCAATASARATYASYKYMWYKLDTINNTAALYGVQKDTTVINIPSTFSVGGVTYNITGVAPYATSRKGYHNFTPYDPSTFKTVSLASSITEIGDHAFEGLIGVTRFSMPRKIEKIGAAAFKNCSAATTMGMTTSGAKSLTTVGDSAFYGCAALTTLSLNENVAQLGQHVFGGCPKLTLTWNTDKVPESYFWTAEEGYKQPLNEVKLISFGSKCTVIPKGFMYENTDIASLGSFGYVATVGDYAFYHCPLLSSASTKTLSISSRIKTVGKYAFAGNKAVKALTLYSNLESVSEGAFSGLDNLKVLTTQSEDPAALYANLPFGKAETDAEYNAVLIVAKGSEKAYAEAAGTKWFKNQLTKVWLNKDGGFKTLLMGDPYHYTLSTSMAGVMAMGNLLLVKDNDMLLDKDVIDTTKVQEYPHMADITSKEKYDQSDWILLTNVPNAAECVGKAITNSDGGIVGQPLDTVNYVMKYTPGLTFYTNHDYAPYDTLKIQGPRDYELNTYIPANFVPQNKYFFVTPKAMELANVKWAQYVGNDQFVMPAKGTAVDTVADVNPEDLEGGFVIYTGLLPEGTKFVEGNIYAMKAVIANGNDATISSLLGGAGLKAPKKADAAPAYVVVPLEITSVTENPTPTGVNDVNAAKAVQSVRYYNVAGQQSATPFEGVNIVVTRYTDGSEQSSKLLK